MSGKIRFSVHPRIRNKPPEWQSGFGVDWQGVEATLEDLVRLATEGVAFVGASMSSGDRCSAAFVSADIAVVDVDNGLTLPEFLAHPLAAQAAAYYTSASHSEAQGRHRFRVIFRLPQRVSDPELLKSITTVLIQELGGDRSCSDPCRLFYGNDQAAWELLSEETTLSPEVIERGRNLAAEIRRKMEEAAEGVDDIDLLQAAFVFDEVIPPTADGERDRFVRISAAAASAGLALYQPWAEWASRGHHGKGKNARQVSERWFSGYSGKSSLSTLFWFAQQEDPAWRKRLPPELRKSGESNAPPCYGLSDFEGDEEDLFDLEAGAKPAAGEAPFNLDPSSWSGYHAAADGSEAEPSAKGAYRPLTEDEAKDPITVIRHRLEIMYPDLRLNRLTLDMEYGPRDSPKVADDLGTAYIRLSLGAKQVLAKTTVYDTACVIAETKAYNPVTSYLEQCGKKEPIDYFDRMATELLGVPPVGEDNPAMPDGRAYADVVLERFCLAAVARAMEPGCSMPWMPILQGNQNVGKTNFLSYLTPMDPLSGTHHWCATIQQGLSTLRERPHTLHAGWIVLFDEAERYFQRRYVEELKNLISVSTDKSSPKYQEQKSFHRSFVLAGATNSSNFLVDSTGNRRFMPIRVLGKVPAPEDKSIRIVDLDRVKRDRDRIWAAAWRLYQAYLDKPGDPGRKPWEFSSHELSHLQAYSESFMVDQPLTGALQQVLAKGCSFIHEGQQAWTTAWLCEQLELRIDAGIATARAISNEMTKLGYVNVQRRIGGKSRRFWLRELTPEERQKKELQKQLGLG
jgi:hypothetical protein